MSSSATCSSKFNGNWLACCRLSRFGRLPNSGCLLGFGYPCDEDRLANAGVPSDRLDDRGVQYRSIPGGVTGGSVGGYLVVNGLDYVYLSWAATSTTVGTSATSGGSLRCLRSGVTTVSATTASIVGSTGVCTGGAGTSASAG